MLKQPTVVSYSLSTYRSPVLKLKVWGENACFTRPENKAERMSYDVMTPSAARNILTAIHWKPAIRWVVERVDVLNPIHWESVRRNELDCKMPTKAGSIIYTEQHRTQRASLILRDVCYVIHAHFELTNKAGDEDNISKHLDIFSRRASKGQCFHRPYLGCREFAAYFSLIHDNCIHWPIESVELGFGKPRKLGYVLLDVLHDDNNNHNNKHTCTNNCRSLFFSPVLVDGSFEVPDIVAGIGGR